MTRRLDAAIRAQSAATAEVQIGRTHMLPAFLSDAADRFGHEGCGAPPPLVIPGDG